MLGFLKRASKAACFSAFLLSSWGKQLEARACRVNLIPYGGKFGCATCHNNVSGGGPRNPFGRDLERIVRQCNGFWNAAIAAMDSDGDGVTNGDELQDPQGTWKPGAPLPGDRARATNPGKADPPPNHKFLRGDANADGKVDMADVMTTLEALFKKSAPLACYRAADANGDGKVNVIDAMYTISFLVSQGSPPPAPFPACGAATGGKLQCDSFAACP